jgi:nicotinate-nucleotide adenylyltransferase
MDRAADPNEARSRRIGIFGGTFDPPHLGHVSVAKDVADALELEQIVWIPAAVPPHKPDTMLAPADARLAMVAAATADDTRFTVSEIELDRPGPSFTADTVRALREQWPDVELFLILGVDQFRELASWHRPEAIVREVTLAVMDRGGESARAVLPEIRGLEDIVFVPVDRVDVSATEVRARTAEGSDISGLVPESVHEIIRDRDLYRA